MNPVELNNHAAGCFMPNEVLIALVGAASSALVAWITARLTWWLELQKWRRSRDDVHIADLRRGLQQLILTASSAAHSMCWLTWLAATEPGRLTKERIEQYDEEMHKLLPRLLGQHALVASLRPVTYWKFKDLIDDLFDADRHIGEAALKAIPGVPASAELLGQLHARSMQIEERIPRTVRAVLADITTPDEAKLFAEQRARQS